MSLLETLPLATLVTIVCMLRSRISCMWKRACSRFRNEAAPQKSATPVRDLGILLYSAPKTILYYIYLYIYIYIVYIYIYIHIYIYIYIFIFIFIFIFIYVYLSLYIYLFIYPAVPNSFNGFCLDHLCDARLPR